MGLLHVPAQMLFFQDCRYPLLQINQTAIVNQIVKRYDLSAFRNILFQQPVCYPLFQQYGIRINDNGIILSQQHAVCLHGQGVLKVGADRFQFWQEISKLICNNLCKLIGSAENTNG